MAFRAVGALRPAVVISAQPGVDGHAVLLLQVGESERWHGFSGAGVEAASPMSRARVRSIEKHVSSKCPTVKSGGRILHSPRRFLCGNAGLHAIVLHCQRSIAAAPRRRAVLAIVGHRDRRNGPAGQFFKDPAAEPGAQAGIRAAEGLIKQQCLGRASRARSRLTRARCPPESVAGSRGRSPPARRGLSASSTAVFAPRRARSPAAPAVNFARR